MRGSRRHEPCSEARILEQREPERLPDQWRMTKVKGDYTMTAVCEVWAVDMGWDLRLPIDNGGGTVSVSTFPGSYGRAPRDGKPA
jgi:hypothetical protein